MFAIPSFEPDTDEASDWIFADRSAAEAASGAHSREPQEGLMGLSTAGGSALTTGLVCAVG